MARIDDLNTVLVTGAAGFVGGFLCNYLTDKGFKVRAAVRCSNLDSVETFSVGDIDGNTDWTKVLEGCDYVVHLAARVHVMSEKSGNPIELYRSTNTEGTRNLSSQAASAGVKRFIYLSSIKVNGEETRTRPFAADDVPNPEDPYAVSKFEAENGLSDICEQSEMEYVIIRPPLVYGSGVKANFLSLIKLINRGIPLPLAAINNRRSLLALGNLLDFILLTLVHKKAGGQVFLISDGEDISTPVLIRKIGCCLGKRPLLFSVPLSLIRIIAAVFGKSSVIDRLAGSLQIDISKAQNLLGWQPPLSQDMALQETVDWFRNRSQL